MDITDPNFLVKKPRKERTPAQQAATAKGLAALKERRNAMAETVEKIEKKKPVAPAPAPVAPAPIAKEEPVEVKQEKEKKKVKKTVVYEATSSESSSSEEEVVIVRKKKNKRRDTPPPPPAPVKKPLPAYAARSNVLSRLFSNN